MASKTKNKSVIKARKSGWSAFSLWNTFLFMILLPAMLLYIAIGDFNAYKKGFDNHLSSLQMSYDEYKEAVYDRKIPSVVSAPIGKLKAVLDIAQDDYEELKVSESVSAKAASIDFTGEEYDAAIANGTFFKDLNAYITELEAFLAQPSADKKVSAEMYVSGYLGNLNGEVVTAKSGFNSIKNNFETTSETFIKGVTIDSNKAPKKPNVATPEFYDPNNNVVSFKESLSNLKATTDSECVEKQPAAGLKTAIEELIATYDFVDEDEIAAEKLYEAMLLLSGQITSFKTANKTKKGVVLTAVNNLKTGSSEVNNVSSQFSSLRSGITSKLNTLNSRLSTLKTDAKKVYDEMKPAYDILDEMASIVFTEEDYNNSVAAGTLVNDLKDYAHDWVVLASNQVQTFGCSLCTDKACSTCKANVTVLHYVNPMYTGATKAYEAAAAKKVVIDFVWDSFTEKFNKTEEDQKKAYDSASSAGTLIGLMRNEYVANLNSFMEKTEDVTLDSLVTLLTSLRTKVDNYTKSIDNTEKLLNDHRFELNVQVKALKESLSLLEEYKSEANIFNTVEACAREGYAQLKSANYYGNLIYTDLYVPSNSADVHQYINDLAENIKNCETKFVNGEYDEEIVYTGGSAAPISIAKALVIENGKSLDEIANIANLCMYAAIALIVLTLLTIIVKLGCVKRSIVHTIDRNRLITKDCRVRGNVEEIRKLNFNPGMSVTIKWTRKGKFFNYGDVVLSLGAGEAGEIVMRDIKRPRKVKQQISAMIQRNCVPSTTLNSLSVPITVSTVVK
ncbi:MAG: hypothetical protein E7377_05535 [Clostridiales bacterium]|nr:hypothetical protein [Clostridiales bacterium]